MSDRDAEAVRVAILAADEGDGAALDAILRDGGGGLIVGPIDPDLAHAVRLAANGDDEALDAMLLGGFRPTEPERALIAELDAGVLRSVGGRGGALTSEQQRVVAARYLAGGSNKQIMAELVEETGMAESTILGWVRRLRTSLKRAPDPDFVLRQIIDPEGVARRRRNSKRSVSSRLIVR